MNRRKLGNTEIEVSALCLGTMTWGEQNTEAEAHEQMDYAIAQGINFFDTAELYPVPPKVDTQGRTEEYIGSWFKKSGKRDQIILATKVVGRSNMEWFRGEEARLSRTHIMQALDASLKRLQTEYIDLYQLHWPERKTNYFGQLGYTHDPKDNAIPLEETLTALGEAVKAGKIRHIGLSNETPWGLAKCLQLAEQKGLPRVVSVQNPYSLLNRTYEIGLAEMSIREKAGLLAYSPLGFGILSGKYRGGKKPAGSRLTLYERFQRYLNTRSVAATDRYCEIAEQHGLSPAQMALAFVTRQPFVSSNIIGATSMAQLKENIDSIHVTLSQDVLDDIEAIHQQNPNPAP